MRINTKNMNNQLKNKLNQAIKKAANDAYGQRRFGKAADLKALRQSLRTP